MKTLIVSLITFLFVISCQENFVSDPLTTEITSKAQNNETYHHSSIILNGKLKDPRLTGDSYYRIIGEIEYEHRLIESGLMQPSSRLHVELNLSTNADILYFCSECNPPVEDELAGFITDESEEYITLTGPFITLFEKSYLIQGREDEMILKCRFLVTSTSIELSAMWLALQKISVPAIVSY